MQTQDSKKVPFAWLLGSVLGTLPNIEGRVEGGTVGSLGDGRNPEQFYEGPAELSVGAGVDEGVDAAVGVAQPEDHLEHSVGRLQQGRKQGTCSHAHHEHVYRHTRMRVSTHAYTHTHKNTHRNIHTNIKFRLSSLRCRWTDHDKAVTAKLNTSFTWTIGGHKRGLKCCPVLCELKSKLYIFIFIC